MRCRMVLCMLYEHGGCDERCGLGHISTNIEQGPHGSISCKKGINELLSDRWGEVVSADIFSYVSDSMYDYSWSG